jgi:acyl-CoA thioester hydrolase
VSKLVPIDDVAAAYVHVVRYHEVDQQGHVYHSRYLEIADAAFSDYLASAFGTTYSALVTRGLDPAVVATEIGFVAPANYEDRLSVFVRPITVGNKSFRMSICIEREHDAQLIATLTTTYVNFDAQARRARAVPEDVATVLRRHVVGAAAESETPSPAGSANTGPTVANPSRSFAAATTTHGAPHDDWAWSPATTEERPQ